jgi:predicted transcriptional regulator
MCNINDYIDETTLYVTTMLNEQVSLTPLADDVIGHLPVAISVEYKFYRTYILQHPLLFCFCLDSTDITPAKLSKQKALIASKIEMVSIFVFDKIASYNLQRLVNQRVNFIVPQKQMFIPDLLVDLKMPKNSDERACTVIPPLAQCVILYKLENDDFADHLKTQDIVKKFGVSYATANRAMRWLSANNILSVEGGKEKNYLFTVTGKSLWNKALPLLLNPIERVVYTDAIVVHALLAGVNALAEYTMINDEANECYAISEDDLKSSGIPTDKKYGDNVIEIWRYNPHLLSSGNAVDKLSLYLTLKDNEDERVQIELDNMIKEIKW